MSARQSGPHALAGKKGQGVATRIPQAGRRRRRRTVTFVGEWYSRIARRRAKAKAQAAVARSILVIIWHLLAGPAARYAGLGYGFHPLAPGRAPGVGGCRWWAGWGHAAAVRGSARR
jgi:hypothetical protein